MEITNVVDNLHYKTGPFDIDELKTAKCRIAEGKAAGPDEIPPEVYKRCDLDNIILDYANNLVMNNHKPN